MSPLGKDSPSVIMALQVPFGFTTPPVAWNFESVLSIENVRDEGKAAPVLSIIPYRW